MTVFRGAVRWQLLISMLAVLLFLPAAAHATPTFLSGINISDATKDAFEPQVVVAPDGTVIAVWSRSDGTNFRIQSSNRTPLTGAWAGAQTISDPGMSASGPAIAVDPSGNAVAVGRSPTAPTSVSTPPTGRAGGSFGAPVIVSAAGAGRDRSRRIDGQQRQRARRLAAHRRHEAPRPSRDPRPRRRRRVRSRHDVSDAGQDAFEPKVAAGPNVDANGGVVWTRSDGHQPAGAVVAATRCRRLPAPEGRDARSARARAGLQRLHRAEPHARSVAAPSRRVPRRCSARAC